MIVLHDAPLQAAAVVPVSVSFSPAYGVAGQSLAGTVTLSAPAPGGGLPLALTINNAASGTALVPEGQTTAAVSLALPTSLSGRQVTVAAIAHDWSAECAVTVNTTAPTPMIYSPASVVAGGPDFTLTLTGTSFTPTCVGAVEQHKSCDDLCFAHADCSSCARRADRECLLEPDWGDGHGDGQHRLRPIVCGGVSCADAGVSQPQHGIGGQRGPDHYGDGDRLHEGQLQRRGLSLVTFFRAVERAISVHNLCFAHAIDRIRSRVLFDQYWHGAGDGGQPAPLHGGTIHRRGHVQCADVHHHGPAGHDGPCHNGDACEHRQQQRLVQFGSDSYAGGKRMRVRA